MTVQAVQRIKDAKAREEIVEARAHLVDEVMSAMTREETRARRVGDEDELDRAIGNLALGEALHAGFGHVLMDARDAVREAIQATDLTPEEREEILPLLTV